jgi:hypothetical protein
MEYEGGDQEISALTVDAFVGLGSKKVGLRAWQRLDLARSRPSGMSGPRFLRT